MKLNNLAIVSMVAVLAAGAQATTWNFDWAPGDGGATNSSAGALQTVTSTFNDVTNQFTFEFTIGPKYGSSKVDGFYLAMNDGPNPKGKPGELAILYFDVKSATDLRLTAYGYNGKSSGAYDSWRDGSTAWGTQSPDKIKSSITDSSWVNNMFFTQNADGSRTMGIDIDATAINMHTPKYPSNGVDYDGIGFDENVGIWFGALKNMKTGYNSHGFLNCMDFDKVTYLDGTNLEAVPEPGTMLVLAGLGAIAARRRFKKN
ncbi:MAG: PEP-CTERM sorting domain-containing protein [Fimbriimonadaceae bacterium]